MSTFVCRIQSWQLHAFCVNPAFRGLNTPYARMGILFDNPMHITISRQMLKVIIGVGTGAGRPAPPSILGRHVEYMLSSIWSLEATLRPGPAPALPRPPPTPPHLRHPSPYSQQFPTPMILIDLLHCFGYVSLVNRFIRASLDYC